MNNGKAIVVLRLPSTLRIYSDGKSQLTLQADTIEQLMEELAEQYPRVWEYLCVADGQLRDHVRMFVNNQLITNLGGVEMEIALKSGQEIIVLPTNGEN